MEDWISIALLVFVGLLLIYLELIFIPGTTFIGLMGIVVAGVGVYIAFDTYGESTGYMVLGGSFAVTVLGLVYSFKAKTWDRFALKDKIEGRFNQDYSQDLKVDMTGVAVSDLKPIGKAEFNNRAYEVASHGHLVESGQEVRISRIERNKIIVDILH